MAPARARRGILDWLPRTMNGMVRCRDVASLLDLAYDAIRNDLRYDRVGILLVDPTGTLLVEHIGTDESGCRTYPSPHSAVSREKALFRAQALREPCLQADGPGYLYLRDATRHIPPDKQHLVDGRPRQLLLVALRTPQKVLGIISVDNLVTARPIREADATPLVAFANALAVAIENATLLEQRERRIDHLGTDLQRRIAELEWLRDVSRQVNAARTLDETLDVVYDGIRDGLGYDRVGIQLLDAEAGWWQDLRGTDAQGHKTRPTDRVVANKDDIRWQSPDLVALLGGAEFHYTDDVYAITPPELRHMLDGVPAHNLNVPLRSSDALIGIISVDNLISGRPISPDDAGPLVALANQLGTAIENARLRDLERAERARLEELLAEVADRANRDPLTGLLHHRALMSRIDEALATGLPLALLLLDVDNFKLFNDTYGHLTGDAVLTSVASILREVCREDDVAGRYGGDEFALLLPAVTLPEARAVADRLARAARACPCQTSGGVPISLSVSIGIALAPVDATGRADLIAVADAAMYAAKRGEARTSQELGPSIGGAMSPPRRRATDLFGESPADVLEGLVSAVDARDRYTRLHSADATRLALLLAEELDMDAEAQRILALAGPLHDVGKIAVPDRILRKPGLLTTDESALVQRHVAYGVAIIRGVLREDAVAEAVATHHEHWDGSGYPSGLAGAGIPLLGRILRIADTVSALQLDRPYRRGMEWPDVAAELRAEAGHQLDPALVEPLIAAVERDRLDAAS